MRAVDALLVDREVENKFFVERRALKIRCVDGLGAAIGLDAGAEEIGWLVVAEACDAEWRAVGNDMGGDEAPSIVTVTGMWCGLSDDGLPRVNSRFGGCRSR